MRLATLVFLCLALLLGGCAMGQPLTPAEVQANGTHTFNAPSPKVFDATVAALSSEGYEIAVANQEKGLIKTGRKLVRADAAGGYGYATAVAVTRQYVVHILDAPNGQTSVQVVPKVFKGDADLSDGEVWLLDGPNGERTLWNRLFESIGDSL